MTAFPSITAVTFDFASSADPLGSPWLGNTYSGNTSNLMKAAGGVASKNQIAAAGFGCQVLGTSYGPDMEAWCKLPARTVTNAQEIFAFFLRLQQDGASTVDGYVVYATLSAGTDAWAIERYVNNSGSGLTTGTQDITAGDYVGAKVEDAAGDPVISAFWCPAASDPTVSGNWTQVASVTDSNVAKITGAGRFAVETQGIVTTFDDLRVGTIVTAPPAEDDVFVRVSDEWVAANRVVRVDGEWL